MNKRSCVCRYFPGLLMLVHLSLAHSETLPVNASVTGGSCNVLLTSSDNASSLKPAPSVELSINAVDSVGIVHGGVSFGDNAVSVSTSCTGVNAEAGTPTISVDGTPILGVGNDYIFRRTDNDGGTPMDTRLGIVISKKPPATYFDTQIFNEQDYIKPGGVLLKGSPGDFGGTFTQTYYFGISCGRNETECDFLNKSTLDAGKIRLELILTFDYK